MTILYKICFNIDRDHDPAARNVCDVNNIYDIVRVCLLSVVHLMSDEDTIVFFLDGADEENVIETICTKFNINYKIYSFILV